jgi:hypothetical protein
MPEQLSSKTWRRRLRISVRGLIVLVLIIGAGLGWIVQGARVQREAVSAIRRDGGVVSYDRDWKYGKWNGQSTGDVPFGRLCFPLLRDDP